jgi:Spy/CpxP family protein refolding chaperone
MKMSLKTTACLAVLVPMLAAAPAFAQQGGPPGNPEFQQIKQEMEQLREKIKADHEKLEADRAQMKADHERMEALHHRMEELREKRHEQKGATPPGAAPAPTPPAH